jgi:hypothetical protein
MPSMFCALLNDTFGAGHIHRPELRVLMSAKLDRLAVGSILKQRRSF